MTWTALLMFALACVGASRILLVSVLLDKPRGWFGVRDLLQCPPCHGFWLGLCFGALLLPGPWYLWIIYGFAGSVLCDLFDEYVGA